LHRKPEKNDFLFFPEKHIHSKRDPKRGANVFILIITKLTINSRMGWIPTTSIFNISHAFEKGIILFICFDPYFLLP